jgi:hypothetical protein
VIYKQQCSVQEDIVHTHTVGIVQQWFEEREGEQHLPWPA